MVENEGSQISDWYGGRNIFITGGSGFMGKVLVEKLLFSCPNIKNIYLLLRNKRSRTPAQRIEDMWKLPMFQRLRDSQPSALRKIIPIQGDIVSKNLDINSEEEALLVNNVSVVFHCAATLKLDAELKDAVEMNTTGTARVLTLAKKMKNLKAFVHLSTAFCSADLPKFEEKVYDSLNDPKDVMDIVRWMKNDILVQITPHLIKPHPNTYTYTKRLAETLVANELKNIRVAIVRPSIVTAAAFEPLPGWVDNLNGPTGLLVGAGKGVIRSMHCKRENRSQSIPVDTAISALIVVAWKLGSAKENLKDVPVYNLTNDGVVPQTWGDVLSKGRELIYENPFEGMIWYPDGDIRSSKLIHNIFTIFLHWLPAYFLDFLLLIFRQKRFMVRLQRKIHDGLEVLQFFTTREWIFESKNFIELWTSDLLKSKDRELFNLDFQRLSVEEYLLRCILGARQYCMKEPLSSLPMCRIKQKFFYVLHKLFVYTLYIGLIYFVFNLADKAKLIFDFTGSYVKRLPILSHIVPNED